MTSTLLALQEVDTKIEQNKYQLQNFPELEKLSQAGVEQAKLAGEREKLEVSVAEIKKNQKRLEDEVASLEEKKSTYQKQQSQTTDLRESQSLEQAIEHQTELQTKWEDEILERMEQAEPLEAQLRDLDVQLDACQAEITQLNAKIASQTTGIEEELSIQFKKRETLVQDIAPEVINIYQKLAEHHQGIAVAELIGNKCRGCDLNTVHSASEVERLRAIPPEELAHCGECQRILIVKKD